MVEATRYTLTTTTVNAMLEALIPHLDELSHRQQLDMLSALAGPGVRASEPKAAGFLAALTNALSVSSGGLASAPLELLFAVVGTAASWGVPLDQGWFGGLEQELVSRLAGDCEAPAAGSAGRGQEVPAAANGVGAFRRRLHSDVILPVARRGQSLGKVRSRRNPHLGLGHHYSWFPEHIIALRHTKDPLFGGPMQPWLQDGGSVGTSCLYAPCRCTYVAYPCARVDTYVPYSPGFPIRTVPITCLFMSFILAIRAPAMRYTTSCPPCAAARHVCVRAGAVARPGLQALPGPGPQHGRPAAGVGGARARLDAHAPAAQGGLPGATGACVMHRTTKRPVRVLMTGEESGVPWARVAVVTSGQEMLCAVRCTYYHMHTCGVPLPQVVEDLAGAALRTQFKTAGELASALLAAHRAVEATAPLVSQWLVSRLQVGEPPWQRHATP